MDAVVVLDDYLALSHRSQRLLDYYRQRPHDFRHGCCHQIRPD
jgi:hypothetical protein